MMLNQAQHKHLTEVITDALKSPRLSDWEVNFCSSVNDGLKRLGIHFEPSEKQMAVIKKIEEKIYASG